MSIATQLTDLNNIKKAIKAALEDKWLSPTDEFDTYAGLIDDFTATSCVADPDKLENFKITVDTSKETGTDIQIYSYRAATIYWGDSNTSSVAAGSTTSHTYASEGIYDIEVDDTSDGGNIKITGGMDKVTACTSFGNKHSGRSLRESFKLCHNLTSVPTDISFVTNLYYAFGYCTSLNDPNISNWNTSSATDMGIVFLGCSSLDQDLSNFDVSNATRTNGILQSCTSFNSPVNNWTFKAGASVNEMFRGANAFNQSLETWDVSNLTSMAKMLYGAAGFEGSLAGWDTSNVTDMNRMCYGAYHFNSDISGFDTSNVTDMSYMFLNAYWFNQDISGWDTSDVTNMDGMFKSASDFDQDISSWCVANIASKPTDFDTNTLATWVTAEKPNWGATCS